MKINDFWAPSKKLILGDSKLLKTLQDYDKDNIAPDIIKKIRKLKENPEFALDRLKTVSKAAHGLACWVYAMESYDRVAKVVGPKKEALAKAQAEYAVVKKGLDPAQAELKKGLDQAKAA